MQLHYGRNAFPEFAAARLQAALSAQLPEIIGLNIRSLILLENAPTFDQATQSQFEALFSLQGIDQTPTTEPLGSLVYVVPRIGTQSSYSSRATDILQHCGLAALGRVEHGREVVLLTQSGQPLREDGLAAVLPLLRDQMTESVFAKPDALAEVFQQHASKAYQHVPALSEGAVALQAANTRLGLALSAEEIGYLVAQYQAMQRDPTDVELMMFAQVNSEHCRHKIFNASWVDAASGEPLSGSLFDKIKQTYKANPDRVRIAYVDNGAVLARGVAADFYADPTSHQYRFVDQATHCVIKVETHNHPTAISPFPGAATGCGGEIRDEAATGRGACSLAGLVGFSVSNLAIPEYGRDWEDASIGYPEHVATALQIMLEAPIGAARFSNEFGRPTLCGYFRTYQQAETDPDTLERVWGYHKPIMLAGGLGKIIPESVHKRDPKPGHKLIVLGGPAMCIGIGGGAASSQGAGSQSAELDFASVQRANPEMQRRAQEVINQCWALGKDNPIESIHDVGAGGLSNALPEIIEAGAGCGGDIDLRQVPLSEAGMSPLEIWCNEAQERYVLAVSGDRLNRLTQLCVREDCPFAVVGEVTDDGKLCCADSVAGDLPIDLDMSVLFGSTPTLLLRRQVVDHRQQGVDFTGVELQEAARRVLQCPAVADKSFLITISDRSVGGKVCAQQMVGPWQVPVGNVAVVADSFQGLTGQAMAVAERSPVAIIDPAAAARLAVAEALTNLMAADLTEIADVALSANWMAACGQEGQDTALATAVSALSQYCIGLGIPVPVGKDSLSMYSQWQDDQGIVRAVTSPISPAVTAFGAVADVSKTVSPELRTDVGDTVLVWIELGNEQLGGSVLAQTFNQIGAQAADAPAPEVMLGLFNAMQTLIKAGQVHAYHDRSDGGLFTVMCEMAFAGHTGVQVDISALASDPLVALFQEGVGAMMQVSHADMADVNQVMVDYGLGEHCRVIGKVTQDDCITVSDGETVILRAPRLDYRRLWSSTTYHMRTLRENPQTAQQAFDVLFDEKHVGLRADVPFDFDQPLASFEERPKVAILRQQGINGHVEMAAAFDRAGFTAVDVTMTDLIAGHVVLAEFVGLAVCGGFSYGDVLGAGHGWASTILHHADLRQQFSEFFAREETFTLGVCNGCQMLSALRELIPGSGHWPKFVDNTSGQFESRLVMVTVPESPSILLADMQDAVLPVIVAHGEGKVDYADMQAVQAAHEQHAVALQYADPQGNPTDVYPYNPNGSLGGITALTSQDGRVTIMMPHPERVFRTVQYPWHPDEWGENGPWMRMFYNARAWVG